MLLPKLKKLVSRRIVGDGCGSGGGGRYGDGGCRLATAGPDRGGRDHGRMLWPLSGVVESERLDEMVADGRAVRAGDFAAVVAVEVQSLVRHH